MNTKSSIIFIFISNLLFTSFLVYPAVKGSLEPNMMWSRIYGGTENDLATSLVATSDGGFAIAGITRSYEAGWTDGWLVKTNKLGVIPEFPSLLIPSLFMIAALIVIISKKRLLPYRFNRNRSGMANQS